MLYAQILLNNLFTLYAIVMLLVFTSNLIRHLIYEMISISTAFSFQMASKKLGYNITVSMLAK